MVRLSFRPACFALQVRRSQYGDDFRILKPGQDATERPQRQLRVLTWGLVPSWAKDPSIGNRMINARMETVAEKPAYRKAFATRRALLPADGYFEWYPTSRTNAKGKPVKQPFFITPADGGVLAMAGLYELWRDPSVPEDSDVDPWLWSVTVLTTSATDDVGRIHDRMPLLVEPSRYAEWLDPAVDDADTLRGLLVPAAPGRLTAYPVDKAVNNVRNNGPQLVDPLPLEGDPSDVDDMADAARAVDEPRLF